MDIHGVQVPIPEYDKAWNECGVSVDLPHGPSFVLPAPATGLNMATGLWCGHCNMSCVGEETMKRHQRAKHETIPFDDRIYTPGFIQQFNNSTGKQWWRVAAPPVPPPDAPDPEDAFADEAAAMLRARSYSSVTLATIQNTNSWLRQTQWHAILAELNADDVRSLVAHLDEHREPELVLWDHAVEQWVSIREDLASVVHVGIRKILVTDKAEKYVDAAVPLCTVH